MLERETVVIGGEERSDDVEVIGGDGGGEEGVEEVG